MKKARWVAVSILILAAGLWQLSQNQPSNRSVLPPTVTSTGEKTLTQEVDPAKGIRFPCRQMELAISIPPGLAASYFANSQSHRPMISIGNSNGEVAGIVWFKDIVWKRNALQFVTDWVLKDNNTDRPAPLDNALTKKLGAHLRQEYWQVETKLGPATLLITKTKMEDTEIQTHSAYLMHKGSILWIYSKQPDLFVEILSSLKEAK